MQEEPCFSIFLGARPARPTGSAAAAESRLQIVKQGAPPWSTGPTSWSCPAGPQTITEMMSPMDDMKHERATLDQRLQIRPTVRRLSFQSLRVDPGSLIDPVDDFPSQNLLYTCLQRQLKWK